jgi:hypothetical protein
VQSIANATLAELQIVLGAKWSLSQMVLKLFGKDNSTRSILISEAHDTLEKAQEEYEVLKRYPRFSSLQKMHFENRMAEYVHPLLIETRPNMNAFKSHRALGAELCEEVGSVPLDSSARHRRGRALYGDEQVPI